MLFIRVICLCIAFASIIMHVCARPCKKDSSFIQDRTNIAHSSNIGLSISTIATENLASDPLSLRKKNICVASTKEAFYNIDLPRIYLDSKPYSFIQNNINSVHASTLIRLSNALMVLYFGGTQEGASDVKIYKSILQDKADTWSKPQEILSKENLSTYAKKYIKKLGNPVAFVDISGRVHVFVVGVSLGGWATSKIYQFYFDNTLEHLHYVRELHLGAFANFSHLVRNPPILLESGGFILPIYHEFADKYALIAFFDKDANMTHVERMNTLHSQLQPSIIATDSTNCIAFFRYYKPDVHNAYMQACTSKQNNATLPYETNIKNYDSSSILVKLGNDVLLIHNDGLDDINNQSQDRRARHVISLFWLKDIAKGEFTKILTLDTTKFNPGYGEISYPSAVVDKDYLHITYTYNRRYIKYVRIRLNDLQKLIQTKRDSNV